MNLNHVKQYWQKNGLDPERMMAVRQRCFTDLPFLALTLGYTKFNAETHGAMWDQFVKKDPSVTFEQFAKADTGPHDRLFLMPRGGYKSTASTIIDSVQYIICWPKEMSILIDTGKEGLGQDFIGEIKAHFERKADGTPRELHGEASLFQLAFPDHCIDGEGYKKSFTTPARGEGTNIKEPSVEYTSIETALSGPHYKVFKFDDPITNENSRLPERIKTIKTQIAMHRKAAFSYSYFDFAATWYKTADYYGALIEAEEKNKTFFFDGYRGESRDTGDRQCQTKIVLRPAMWPKTQVSLDDPELREEDWELWFPTEIPWKFLMKELSRDREVFASQMMNNPRLSSNVKFTRDRLISATKPFTQLQDLQAGGGIIVQTWDTTYRDRVTNDYTVGTTALILRGLFYILDIIRGHFNEFELPRVIAEAAYRWKPQRIAIEELNGIHWLLREIYREQDRLNYRRFIELAPIVNVKNRKKIMAAPLAKAILEDRFIFSNAIPKLDDVYNELEGFDNGAPNDDIVDSLALAVNYFAMIPEAAPTGQIAIEREVQLREQRREYERIHGIGRFNTMVPSNLARTPDQVPAYIAYSPTSEF